MFKKSIMKNISIKTKLFSLPILVITSFVLMYILMRTSFDTFDNKAVKASQANEMIKNILKARISEKIYTRKKDEKYAQEVEMFLKKNIRIARRLELNFTQKDNKDLAIQMKKLFENYLLSFKKYQMVREKSLNAEKDMIKEARDVEDIALEARAVQKKQRDMLIAKHASLNLIIDKIEKASFTNRIIKELNEIRISEKNYIRRKDTVYKEIIDTKILAIETLTKVLRTDFKNHKNKIMMDKIKHSLAEYQKAFERFSVLRENSFILLNTMDTNVREAENLAMHVRKDQKDEREKLEYIFNTTMIFLFFIIGLLMLVITLYLASSISKGIDKVLAKTLDVIKGNDKQEIVVTSDDELGKLAKNFNIMIYKIDEQIVNLDSIVEEKTKELKEKIILIENTQDILVENEKMAALGSLVSGVAHEINTPIGNAVTGSTIIKRETSLLLEKMKDGSLKKSTLETSIEHIDETSRVLYRSLESVASLIKSFKMISVDQNLEEKRKFDLVEYIGELIKTFHTKLKQVPVDVKVIGDAEVIINSDPSDFMQLLNNFIQNSIIHGFEFKKENAQIIIEIRQKKDDLYFIYSDNGAGMSDELKHKAFEPFVTTKRNAGGTGLGLNIVHNIVTQKLKGRLILETKLREGTKFTIVLRNLS